MDQSKKFQLNYLREEEHLLMPTRVSILVTQQLYDIFFQYCITREKEELLLSFIKLMETHIKNKDRTPFSFPIADLAAFEEGAEELRLLSWYDRQVQIFAVEIEGEYTEQDHEDVLSLLSTIMTCRWNKEKRELYVFPSDVLV